MPRGKKTEVVETPEETVNEVVETPEESNTPILNEEILEENRKLKEELELLRNQKGATVFAQPDSEVEQTTYVYKALYPRKLKISGTVTRNMSDGMGGYTREVIRNAIYAMFEGGKGMTGGFLTLNKQLAQSAGISVTEYKKRLESNSQFGNEFELILSSKDGGEVKKYISKLSGQKEQIRSGIITTG